jgi:hypothetical protein
MQDRPMRGQAEKANYLGKWFLALCNIMQDADVIRTSPTTVRIVSKAGSIDLVGMTLPASAFTTIESGCLVDGKLKGSRAGTKDVP